MLTNKSLLDYFILFSPNECEKNDKIIIKIFLVTKMIKIKKIHISISAVSIENLKNLKYHTFLKKH